MEPIGGQAVIEGVMLRAKNKYVVTVRNPRGKIVSTVEKIKDYRKGILRLFNLPFFRGIYAMYEMLTIGLKSLVYSTNINSDEDEKLSLKEIILTIFLSLLLVIGLFVIAPYVLTTWMGINEVTNPIIFNIIDSVIKFSFFIAYIFVISRMNDVKRVFQYHGAEHMAVHCYEHGLALQVKNVKRFSPIHNRCGSSFIMHVIVLSIVVFSLLPLIVYGLFPLLFHSSFWSQKAVLLSIRIIMIPVIIGLSYELLKVAGKYPNNIIVLIASWPGAMLQRLTTAVPNEKQILVAIAAIKALKPKGMKV